MTKSRPWTSYHQYGFAADFVLYLPGDPGGNAGGTWSWDTTTVQNRRYWAQLETWGEELGLETLSWEKPHLQLANLEDCGTRQRVLSLGR